MDRGNFADAVALLEKTIASLKDYGARGLVTEAIGKLEALLAQVSTGKLSLRERKLSKYRSHSFRKMSSSEHWSVQEPAPSFKAKTVATTATSAAGLGRRPNAPPGASV